MSPKLWFSIQIQMTCAYLRGGVDRVPQMAVRAWLAGGTVRADPSSISMPT